MDLQMSSHRMLVPEGLWCVFYATKRQVYWGLTHNVVFCWYSDLISHIHKHSHAAHSRAIILTHPYKYILTPPVICLQQLSLLLWMHNSLISKIYLWNTNNTDTNGKTNYTHSMKDNTEKGLLVWKWMICPFFKITPLFYQPIPFYGKNLNRPCFFWKFRKLEPSYPFMNLWLKYRAGLIRTSTYLNLRQKCCLTWWSLIHV